MNVVDYWNDLAQIYQLNKSQVVRKLISDAALKEGLIKTQLTSEV
jgi:hypothetical protein|tara:strand:+ start:1000 stop:1134 length:135 start_codon:yes stop_codon:yes gene_type:complete